LGPALHRGKRRELGLGAADRASIEAAGTSLKRARKKAGDARDLLDKGTDPIDARRAHREAERSKAEEAKGAKKAAATTVLRYARAYHEKHVEPVRSDKHGKQWIASIEQHVPKALLDSPIDTITAVDLLDAMVPVLRKLPETGSRVYQRLSTIFDPSSTLMFLKVFWFNKLRAPFRCSVTPLQLLGCWSGGA
jgi:hypothetical protein